MSCLTKPTPESNMACTPLFLRLPISISSPHQEHHRRRIFLPRNTHILKSLQNPTKKPPVATKKPPVACSSSSSIHNVGSHEMWALCGFGYWVQGFRCFPWLALNFHMLHSLRLSPSTLQLVQQIGNLPLVAKPLFGVISDSIYIGGDHRLPYISIGVVLQILSWGTLSLIPFTGETFPLQMLCIILSNLGASVTEVVSDALVAEFGRTQKAGELQSYAFIALTAGSLFGNLSGGFILHKTEEPNVMFFCFAFLLTIQLALSMTTKETPLNSPVPSNHRLAHSSISKNLRRQFSDLVTVISEERILYPLSWVVTSVAIVPLMSGSMFCFQTQFLKLDPSVIGLSKVIGQLAVLAATVLYNQCLKQVSTRKLIFGVQILYAISLLSDLFLVKQINIKLGISNEVYVICLSALAEAIAQFKLLPFTVLFSTLCPPRCEGSLFAFLAASLCLSSILSGIFGIGLASFIGVTSVDYSSLPLGILVQFTAALVPLGWMSYIPVTPNVKKMGKGEIR